jgi:hypothetical protein
MTLGRTAASIGAPRRDRGSLRLRHERGITEPFRLAITCQAFPIAIQRGQTGDVPVTTMLAIRPRHVTGRPATRYVTLKNVAYGLSAAYEVVWGRR